MMTRHLFLSKQNLIKLCCCFVVAFSVQISSSAFPEERGAAKTLIIHYSRSGKTKLISETLAKNIGADILEIRDPKDRSGWWGFITSGLDAFRHVHTPIKPEHPDLTPYSVVIIASPIWSWNVSTPIHTLFERNRFDGKKLILLTTANIHIMKYEQFGEEAPFIKRYLKDYLRDKRKAAVGEVINAGGDFIGHYHFETQAKTDDQLIDQTLQCVEYVKEKLS
jgi:flavodoxin